jgi:hypothetical protein
MYTAQKILVNKPEGKRLLRSPRYIYGRITLKWGA